MPLVQFERFRTTELAEAQSGAGLLLSRHRLSAVERQPTLDVRYNSVSLVDTTIICAQYGAPVTLDPGALENFYLIGMTLLGTSRLIYGHHELLTHPGLASVQSCGSSVMSEWHRGCRKLSIKVDRLALERRIAAWLGHPLHQPVAFELALDLERGPGASWQRLMHFLLAEVLPGSTYLSSEAARRSMDEMLINALLFCQPHTYSEALRKDATALEPRQLTRVEELVAADPAAPHTLTSLAEHAGVSIRSLQAAFRRHRGTTPTGFVRARRLAMARAAMLSAGPGALVTAVALDVGYAHLSRFAQDYKKQFGELPSRTLARTRGRSSRE